MILEGLPFRKFDDLYSLLYNETLLIQTYGNIQRNKGSLTPGISNETVDSMSLKKIKGIAMKIKSGKFKFAPIRRKFIKKMKIYKPGMKIKYKPLGIPNFDNRIIQEAIRIILESIYEPIFEKGNYNYGFRPNKGCHHAIEKLKILGTGMTIAGNRYDYCWEQV